MQHTRSFPWNRIVLVHLVALGVGGRLASQAQNPSPLRPPSVPLVACDPYFSIWSPADKLTDADTVHWTGKPHRLVSLVRIDGVTFRIMGREPANLPDLPQATVEVLPTRTSYTFDGHGIHLLLTFMTAALPDDLMVYSRPVTYLTWTAGSTDGKDHTLEIYFEASAELAVDHPGQSVAPSHDRLKDLEAVKIGSADQAVLAKKGDDLRIDWGFLYAASRKSEGLFASVDRNHFLRSSFASLGFRRSTEFVTLPQAAAQDVALCFEFDKGKVGSSPISRHLVLAYDDEYSIQYFKRNLRPYWRRNGEDAAALLKKAVSEYESLKQRCERFDTDLMTALGHVGGEKYARLCALAYRQCYAANKVVADANGQPLMFPKENFSNGCIGTVDVIYPMAPQFLLFSPSLTKAMLVPILDYAASPRWRWPFAPHDLGTYPLANGQVYGGGERTEEDQMPVEETGNMLLMVAALAQVEGNANFSAKYWPVLEKWADYLVAKGFDPENQLCTDDFAGHLAHNVNLSAKAVCGLGAFAKLCDARGDKAKTDGFMRQAKDFAARWVKESDDDDHSRLTFNGPGTWSQKYNLVWDRILGLKLFPDSVYRKEMDFYKTKQNNFGLPLDNRKAYTKLDWTLWTATLTQDRADFEALLNPVWRFLNETPNRVPMTDWFGTQSAKQEGFQARSVVGGVFLQMLYDSAGWKMWARRDTTKAANWAPLPKPPKTVSVVPTAEKDAVVWRYTTQRPADGWFEPGFDASSWKEGPAGFGTKGTPGAVIRTEWKTADVWLRREFELPVGKWPNLQLRLHHDEDAEVYFNGVQASGPSGYSTDYDQVPIRPAARAALKPGKNLVAVHCHQTTGGQYIDVGLVEVQTQD